MIDELALGLLGGLFGPAIAHWMSRYKYWVVFLFAMFSTQILFFGFMLRKFGFDQAIKSFDAGIIAVFFFIPMGIGLIAVIIAFVGSLNAKKNYSDP